MGQHYLALVEAKLVHARHTKSIAFGLCVEFVGTKVGVVIRIPVAALVEASALLEDGHAVCICTYHQSRNKATDGCETHIDELLWIIETGNWNLLLESQR